MKKLMTVLASAATALCAVGAWADFTETSTDFESSTAGLAFDSNNGMDSHWVGASDAELFISNHTDTISVSRPDYVGRDDNANENYLAIDNSVTRGLNTVAGGEFAGVAIPTDGIYLDTLVKFTAADEVFGEDALAGGDKIAIEYVAQGDDVDNPITNFVIRAGKTVEGSLVSANYLAAVPAGFDVNEWHRLTVRVIDNVGNGQVGQVGFVIYLDGDVNKLLAYDTNVDAGFGELNPTAQKFYNSSLHALYPSAVGVGDDKGTIASATFSGTGCIDDVVFTTTTPNFIQQGESVVVSFVADAGVTAISVSVDGEDDPFPVVNGSATLPAQTADFTVNVTVDEANGYTLGGISYNGTPLVNGEVTGYAGGDITITTIRNNFNLFDTNGDPIQGTFQTLTEALAKEGVAMIKLAYDYDALAFEGEDFDGYDIDGEIVLDLNGNDLDGGDDSAGVSLFRVADTLTIKDSVGGGSITYDTQYEYAIVKNDGSDVFIGAATGDAGATFNGKLFEDGYEGAIIKGNIDNANNADEGVFLWGRYVDDDSDYERVGDYWVVEPQGGSTTFALTTTGGENAEIVTDPANVSALTEATDVTITATATNGFTYATVDLSGTDWSYNSNDDAISMTTNISEDTEIAVPDAVAKTVIGSYEVTVIPTNNTTYAVVGAASNEGDVYTVATGHSITITVTPDSNYEYAEAPTGWTLSEGVITKEISEAGTVEIPAPTAKQQGGYPSYIDTTDAEAKAKYDAWKDTYGADTGSEYEEAFLLNCAPAEVATEEAAFKFTAIYQDSEGNWVAEMPEKNTKGNNYNGTVTIKRYSDVGCTVESESGNFFKATLD